MNQLQLDFEPKDPNVKAFDVGRLAGQNAAIYEMLLRGPVSVDELSRVSRKYTSRISDLRAMGLTITCHRQPGGNNLYVITQ